MKLRLRGKALVIIDWANVYGWRSVMKIAPEPASIRQILEFYPEVQEVHFFYGTDDHPKSRDFFDSLKEFGWNIHTKPVKYINRNTSTSVKTPP
jgi:hypothetical protein